MADGAFIGVIKEILNNECTTRKKVLVIGDAILDVYHHGEMICVDGRMPMHEVRSTELCLGGALNVANNIRAIGLDVTCVSIIGTDGEIILKKLQDRDIDAVGVIYRPDLQTKTITRYSTGKATLFRVDKVSECDIEPEVIAELLARVKECCSVNKYDLIILCDYRNGMMTSEFCYDIIKLARSHGTPVIVDPKRGDYEKYRGATVIKPNIDDAKTLCGSELTFPQDARTVCKTFTEQLDVDICMLTMSDHGIAYYCAKNKSEDEKFGIINPEYRKLVVDVNGAGDAVTSAIAFGIVHDVTLDTSCRFAVACAENVIQRYGTVTLSLKDVVPGHGDTKH